MSFGFDLFVERWLEKADSYDDRDLGQLFDKFFTLYVSYNSICEEVFKRLRRSGAMSGQKNRERMKAVDHIASFLGYDELALALRAHEDQISQVEIIMRERRFFFNVTGPDNKADWSRDRKDMLALRAPNSKEFCLAILNVIYRTRCNMFHGQKGLDAEQGDVLRPVNVFLRTIIELALAKMGY